MATKQAQADVVVENVEAMDDDALLKIEQEMKAKLAQIEAQKKARESNFKARAFGEIQEVLKKYFGTVLTKESFAQWLVQEQYIEAPKVSAVVGRRKIADEDLLFSFKYKNETGDRDLTLKLDAMSDVPASTSASAKQLKKLQAYEYNELKKSFKPKFFEWVNNNQEEGISWVKKFFPQIEADIQKILKKEEAEA